MPLSLLYGPALTSVQDYWKNHKFDSTDLCWQSNGNVKRLYSENYQTVANNEMLEAYKSPVLKKFLPLSFTGADDGYLKKNHKELTMSALGAGEQDAVRGISPRDLETVLYTGKSCGTISMFSF